MPDGVSIATHAPGPHLTAAPPRRLGVESGIAFYMHEAGRPDARKLDVALAATVAIGYIIVTVRILLPSAVKQHELTLALSADCAKEERDRTARALEMNRQLQLNTSSMLLNEQVAERRRSSVSYQIVNSVVMATTRSSPVVSSGDDGS